MDEGRWHHPLLSLCLALVGGTDGWREDRGPCCPFYRLPLLYWREFKAFSISLLTKGMQRDVSFTRLCDERRMLDAERARLSPLSYSQKLSKPQKSWRQITAHFIFWHSIDDCAQPIHSFIHIEPCIFLQELKKRFSSRLSRPMPSRNAIPSSKVAEREKTQGQGHRRFLI